MENNPPEEVLRNHRPLLLSMEAIGWLHMAGKAHPDFLRDKGGAKKYKEIQWYRKTEVPFDWNVILEWVQDDYSNLDFPSSLAKFITDHQGRNSGLLGLLQAAHGIVSGTEKNLPNNASEYLNQDTTHMWLSTAFGYPVRNLLSDPPDTLKKEGWKQLILSIHQCLSELENLGKSCASVEHWWAWRERAIGSEYFLRKAFTSTLAETRLPNNDVTLWDQSYVAAALFKSALAGALLDNNFPWKDKQLKQNTRWRILSVGFGFDHYEARSVRIVDLIGAKSAANNFLEKVRKFIEIDLALGSMLYKDDSIAVFSFPGLSIDDSSGLADMKAHKLCQYIQKEVDSYAEELNLENPPHCILSFSSRSLLKLSQQLDDTRKALAIPVSRSWSIRQGIGSNGHVCPVCKVRFNNDPTDKQKRCSVCNKRRSRRLMEWMNGKKTSDTIWLSEVADKNDRLAVITLSLDLENWLNGTHIDSLRSQSAYEWNHHNKKFQCNLKENAYTYLQNHVEKHLDDSENNFEMNSDDILKFLHIGFQQEKNWKDFFEKIVEDRAFSPEWENLSNEERAKWITHQVLRKYASSGRIYRFQRQTEEFFNEVLMAFREIVSSDRNRWRTKRLIFKSKSGQWKDQQTYSGRWKDAPVSLLYRDQSSDFITICNMERLLKDGHQKEILCDKKIELKDDDSREITPFEVMSVLDKTGELGVYHPIIPLEVNPRRFRVVVPLNKATECIKIAIEMWHAQFSRVEDRMPLRIGVVSFPRMMPYQAVIESVRNLEHELEKRKQELWQVIDRDLRDGIVSLLIRSSNGEESLRTIPVKLPDGRLDVFYTYFAVEDSEIRFPKDFQSPEGIIYRHVLDLRPKDLIYITPAVVGTVFMESAANRFDNIPIYNLDDWQKIIDLWHLLKRVSPSQTALLSVWARIREHRKSWQSPDGALADDAKETWLFFVRSIFSDRFNIEPESLEYLVRVVDKGLFDLCMDWHVRVLKMKIEESDMCE
ncbi:CRISPR-associated protein Csx11 [Methanosarcina siciliae C2J]|uniref:CRISPR-associated protein Csx11 n=1 Tax=Methanosarcina siciliae C2J TaxID=1434118 RepID=A0A0E3PMS4_9EURY|nr:CRISPR-associated protein Csx11 [Methanosarcina siciliae]AKB36820.1 CRISPR-associated protein Csx11 [Methanosarcina siciliae C2J]